eukprot:Skav224398  [mRNA]  locus=scaffold2452:200661:206794:- [translate_table: standard]
MSIIVAVEMSSQPFKSFQFDGILGLGLPGLTMSRTAWAGVDGRLDLAISSCWLMLVGGCKAQPRFGVFLCDGEFGEQSEVSFGGLDPRRLMEPISWSNVAMEDARPDAWSELGVRTRAIRINGEVMEVCDDGTCRGVLDTGTSHLGIPAPFDKDSRSHDQDLQTDAGDLLDCRNAEAPLLEIELHEGKVITLYPFNYMRRLPLRDGVTVGSKEGRALRVMRKPPTSSLVNCHPFPPPLAAPRSAETNSSDVRRRCSPRLMAVKLPEPLGPKLFILGEPVLHRYYTVYDWEEKKATGGSDGRAMHDSGHSSELPLVTVREL